MYAHYLDTVRTLAAHNLPVLVGAGVGVVVLAALAAFRGRRRRGVLDPATLLPERAASPSVQEKALEWVPPDQSYGDRRGAIRREGAPVRVLLASPAFRGGTAEGYVVDRSTGGLRLALTAAVAPGSTVQVRAANAPDTIGFVTLIIRSCRKNADHFVAGCEFEKTPPWNVLLLFG